MAENYRACPTALIGAGLVGAAIMLGAAPAVAADWHLSASITEEFTYDNNFNLNPDENETLWGFNTRPRAGFETHTPRTDLELGGSLNYGYFPDRTSENSFDQAGNASLTHRTERSTFSFGGNVSNATTRTTEDADTGRNFSDAYRLGLDGNAAWSYALTETVGAGIQGGASYVTYETSDLDDYRTFSGGPFVTVQLSEKDSVRFNATYTNFETLSGLDNNSDLYVGTASWTHVFHPQWQMTVRVGASYTDQEEEVAVAGGSTVTQHETRWAGDGGISPWPPSRRP